MPKYELTQEGMEAARNIVYEITPDGKCDLDAGEQDEILKALNDEPKTAEQLMVSLMMDETELRVHLGILVNSGCINRRC